MHNERWRRHGRLDLNNPTARERFEMMVDRSDGPGSCHTWMGTTDVSGYGRFNPGGDRRGNLIASRWIIEERIGFELSTDLHVCHTCDNPPCVNERHLFIGTQADNMRDAQLKGHLVSTRRKLTDVQVTTLRQRYADGGTTIRELASDFGVSYATTYRIINKERYVRASNSA